MNNIYDPEFVKGLFNQMSGSYERMNYITSFGFSIRWRKQFLSQLGRSDEPLLVMDLLSGLGENWSYLKQNFPNSEFHALDFSENMIDLSRSKAQKLFKGNLNIVCADVLKNSIASNSVDIVTCAYGLKTFNEEQLHNLAREIHRILKPNGRFSFVEVSKPKNRILRGLYQFYLSRIIPILGKLFLGNPEDYKMLWVYTDRFENTGKVLPIFEKYGLKVQLDSYFAGCATGITGRKY